MKAMPVFALGFRPLYLLAGLYAALGVPLWALQFSGWLPGANLYWHAHEMLFGYAFAVIAGFLLTAVRVWAGRAPRCVQLAPCLQPDRCRVRGGGGLGHRPADPREPQPQRVLHRPRACA